MLWVRRFFVQVFSALFLISLLGLALTSSINNSFSQSTKVKTWLEQSKVYDNFIINIVNQSQKSLTAEGVSSGQKEVDAEIGKAAAAAFSSEFLKSSADQIIEGNYAWLQGKTAAPKFSVDLTLAKQDFAKRVGDYATERLEKLPACTPEQTAQLGTDPDPLTVACLPAGISVATAGQEVADRLLSDGGLLEASMITPETLVTGQEGGEPYYKQLAQAPKIYQLAQKLPLLLAVVAVMSGVVLVAVSPLKRKGIRRLGWVLLISGILLTSARFVTDFVLNRVEKGLLSDPDVGVLQKSLLDFTQLAEKDVLGTAFLFGSAYSAIGLLILLWIFLTRHKKPPVVEKQGRNRGEVSTTPEAVSSTPPTKPDPPKHSAPGAPPLKQNRPKKPKLIQL